MVAATTTDKKKEAPKQAAKEQARQKAKDLDQKVQDLAKLETPGRAKEFGQRSIRIGGNLSGRSAFQDPMEFGKNFLKVVASPFTFVGDRLAYVDQWLSRTGAKRISGLRCIKESLTFNRGLRRAARKEHLKRKEAIEERAQVGIRKNNRT